MSWEIGTTINTKHGTGTITAFKDSEAVITLPDGSTTSFPIPEDIKVKRSSAKSRAAKAYHDHENHENKESAAMTDAEKEKQLDDIIAKAKAKLASIKK